MASPFHVFRKYQKTLLAIAGVVLMFVFVVGDSLFSYMGGGRGGRPSEDLDAKATAVQWDGGKLTNRQLQELVTRRQILNKFLRDVEMQGRAPSYAAGVEPPELRVQSMLAPETPQQQVEASVVKTKLFADAARASGMKISDEALVNYLHQLGRANVSPVQMRAMLDSRSLGGMRLSIDYIIEALREQMLANNYRISNAFAMQTVTPEQRWKDWARVNDRVVVEAAAVPAEMYLPDVKEPTDAELAEFFNKYKDREAVPDFYGNLELPSATPGFRIPRKIDLQYIEADYEEFLAKAEAKITDEEVAKFYEEHKDLFPKINVGLNEDTDAKAAEPNKDASADPQDEAKDAQPADAEKKAAEPAETKSEAPEKSDKPEAPKDGKAEEKSSDTKKSSYRHDPAKRIFRLTAFAEDAAKSEQDTEKAAEKASDVPAAKADATTEAKPAAPAEPATPLAEPATAPAAPVVPGAPATAVDAAAAPAKPVEYQPLSEVKDEIRKRLAEQKVADELSKLASTIQDQLQSEFEKWRYADHDSSETGKNEMPAPPKSLTDFAAIAQKHGLKTGQTGLKSLLELRDLPVGKTVTEANIPLLQLLFASRDLELHQPVTAVDRTSKNIFVVAKMEEKPGRVPTLDEVKPEVIKAWKFEQAAKRAQEAAADFAKKAQDEKTPLASFFTDNKLIKVVRTDPFSELTGGEVGMIGGQIQQQPYRWSQPSELVAVGPDFVRDVFNLKDGQVSVLLNNDHSIAYVVRVVEHQPGLAELRNNYLADANSWYGESMMNQMRLQEIAGHMERDIETSTKLKWEREHDRPKNGEHDET